MPDGQRYALKMSCRIIRTVIPPRMEITSEIPPEKKYRPWLLNPPNLLHLAGDVVNELPMPDCWEWDISSVSKWLRNEIGLPQYKDCFERNFINGRRLILINACACSSIGIHDLGHTKRITAGIRKLFNIEPEDSGKRSISLPPRYPLTHYLQFRVPTGPTRENTTRFQLFKMMGILDEEEPCPFGHWEMLRATRSDYPVTRFGLVRRKNVYLRNEHQRQPRGHSYLIRSKLRDNYFIRINKKAI